ncbi:MAG: hypothetical protein KBG76_16830, partial [Saprospiraceae bacterium]|nr:hypothetical protein [Saprospiraceae bacterium]
IKEFDISDIDFCFVDRIINDKDVESIRADCLKFIFGEMKTSARELGTTKNFKTAVKKIKIDFDHYDYVVFSNALKHESELRKHIKDYGIERTSVTRLAQVFGLKCIDEIKGWLISSEITKIILEYYKEDKEAVREVVAGKGYEFNDTVLSLHYNKLEKQKDKKDLIKIWASIYHRCLGWCFFAHTHDR